MSGVDDFEANSGMVPRLQMRTWENHDVGATPGFGGDVGRALKCIKVPILYTPSQRDLHFPIGDAPYETAFIPGVSPVPIASVWGHTAGRASNPADAKSVNETIGTFLAVGKQVLASFTFQDKDLRRPTRRG